MCHGNKILHTSTLDDSNRYKVNARKASLLKQYDLIKTNYEHLSYIYLPPPTK